jgi:hypothetical protein
MGSMGWRRSSAWICDFSSTQSTMVSTAERKQIIARILVRQLPACVSGAKPSPSSLILRAVSHAGAARFIARLSRSANRGE